MSEQADGEKIYLKKFTDFCPRYHKLICLDSLKPSDLQSIVHAESKAQYQGLQISSSALAGLDGGQRTTDLYTPHLLPPAFSSTTDEPLSEKPRANSLQTVM